MKERNLWTALGLFGAACLALGLSGAAEGGAEALLAFPFAQIGQGLRWLSLSGPVGDLAAWTLYLLLSLLPCLWLAVRVVKKRAKAEDALLGLAACLLLVVLYRMVNPAGLPAMLGSAAAWMGKAFLGLSVWSVLCCYGVLRRRRAALEGDPARLSRWLLRLVYVVMAAFVADICGVRLPAFFRAVSPEDLFPLLTLAAGVIPDVYALCTARWAARLLECLGEGRYTGEAVAAAGRLAGWCGRALAAAALCQLGHNLLQLLFAPTLSAMDLSVQLPLLGVVFLLAALLLARLVARGYRLQQDNDLFI